MNELTLIEMWAGGPPVKTTYYLNDRRSTMCATDGDTELVVGIEKEDTR